MSVRPEDLAQTLVERKRAERIQHERRAEQLRAQMQALAPTLGAHRVWLFGSLTTPAWGRQSDVDVAVEGLPVEALSAVWAQLETSLQHKVDLLRIEELPPAFAARIREEGTSLV